MSDCFRNLSQYRLGALVLKHFKQKGEIQHELASSIEMTEYAATIAAVVVKFVGYVDRLKLTRQLLLARLQNPKTE